MTEQYLPRNINDPAGANTIANTIAAPNSQLSASDVGKVVYFDTTAVAGTVTLPRSAEAGPGAEITVVFPAATIVLTGTLAVIGTGVADILVTPPGAPANPATTAGATKIVRADGVLSWNIVSGLA